jgi:hypothetical protein
VTSEEGTRAAGTASVEHVGLVALLAAAALATLAALGPEPPQEEGRSLASTLARKIRCAARLPGPCWRDPLSAAYGRPLAGAVRTLAPAPSAIAGPGGEQQTGVDFRRCRRPSCAVPLPGERGEHLTVANRRTVTFTAVEDRRRAGGDVRISYWIYRPRIRWEEVVRRADPSEVADLASTPLLDAADPRLIPLETLPGRNHYEFPPLEEPPWRWQVAGIHPG